MSKLTKEAKIEIIKKMNPPVKLTGKESLKEIDAIISERNGVEPAQDAEIQDAPAIPKKEATSSVTITLSDGRKRVFTSDVHGEDFATVANEFHETNKRYVLHREDK